MQVVRRMVVGIVFSLAAITTLAACSTTYKEGQKVTITGRLRLVGNEPFTHVVVSTADKVDYYLPDEARGEYRTLIGSQVSVEGTFTEKTLELADHSKSFIQYHLIDITGMKPQDPPGR